MNEVTISEGSLEHLDNGEQASDKVILDIKKRSIAGAFSYFFRTIFLNLIGIVSAIILSYALTPEDFGLYGFVMQAIGVLIFFSDIGLAAALVQKKTEPTEDDYSTVFVVQQLLSWGIVAICLILVIIATKANEILASTPQYTHFLLKWLVELNSKMGQSGYWILLAVAVSFPLAAGKTIPSIKLERKLDFSKLVIPQIVEQFAFHTVLIYLALNHYGAISYAYAVIFRSVLGLIMMYLISPWRMQFKISKISLQSLLHFGVKFQLNDALARVKDQLFYTVLGFYLPLNQFGYIQWSKTWSMYPYNFTVQNVMAITFPTFARLQNNKEFLRKAIEKSIFFITILIFPILVGMSIFIIPLIQLIPAYAKWYPAVFSLVFFLLDIAWSAVGTPLINALSAIGKINVTLKIMILRTFLTWLLTPLAMYWWGFNGVAIATFAINITSLIPIWYLRKFAAVNIWEATWRQLVSAIFMALIGLIGMNYWGQSWLWLISGMIVVGSSYLGMLLIIDKDGVISQFKKLRAF